MAIASAECEGLRLDRALALLFPDYSRSALARFIDGERIRIDGRIAGKASEKIFEGQQFALDVPEPLPAAATPEDIPIVRLYEDDDLLVIDKPAGLVVHPASGHAGGTLVNALLFHVAGLSGIGGEIRPGIVHRLDKDTSGVMVIAKNDATHRALAAEWGSGRVQKEYLALVYGGPGADGGTIDAPIGRDARDRKRMAVTPDGRRAVTEWHLVSRMRYVSLLRLRLLTGRTHQIRVHLKHHGHPIVGDPLYSGPQWRGIPDRKLQKALSSLGRQALHATRIVFPHPRTGAIVSVEAALPADLTGIVTICRGTE